MSNGDPRDPWDLRRLGDEDFASQPLDPRSRESDEDEYQPGGSVRSTGQGRRMRPDERDALRRQARERRQLPPEYFGAAPPEPPKRTWPRWGGVALILVVIVIAGNVGFFRGRDSGGNGTPEGSGVRTATSGEIAIAASPTPPQPSPTPEATATEAPTPTQTPEPTPDPRFAGIVVCLDPGHGGSDRGYKRDETAAAPALEEAPLNLEFALAVQESLEAYGFDVVLTRTTDKAVNTDAGDVNGDGRTVSNQTGANAESAEALDELQARINVCNEAGADLLVSLHINGYPDASISGYETWYSASRPFVGLNRLIASLVYDELKKGYAAAGYNVPERGVRDDATVDVDSHLDLFDSYVITGPSRDGAIVASEMPGTIAEVLFISSETDAPILASESGKRVIVDAYVRAIIAYFNTLLGPAEREE